MTIQNEKLVAKVKDTAETGEGSRKFEITIRLVTPHDTKSNNIVFKKLQDNLKEIIRNSNATPIKRVIGYDYVCAYCDYQNPTPVELKKHTIYTHSREPIVTLTKGMSANNLLVKLDITNLRCNLCQRKLETLEQLLEHLQSAHKIKIHMDVLNQILPFKFDGGPLTCFICKASFLHFKLLNIHVNMHYTHYICDVCCVGFVNHCKLKKHMATHKSDSFVCSHCSKDFDSIVKMQAHEKQVHGTKLQLKCLHCEETFDSIFEKEKHMSDSHGIVSSTAKCEYCDKVFCHRKALIRHVKRMHLMDRYHDCPECDKKFFGTKELKDHMLKHTGDRKFQCQVCLKWYLRKPALREHMRIHENDRRFKCEHCEMSFIQKCSWKAHVDRKHRKIA